MFFKAIKEGMAAAADPVLQNSALFITYCQAKELK